MGVGVPGEAEGVAGRGRHKFKYFSRSFGPRDTVMACSEASTIVYVGI